MRKSQVVVLVVVVGVLAALWSWRRHGATSARPAARGSAEHLAAGDEQMAAPRGDAGQPGGPGVAPGVRRLSREDRRLLGEQIAAAVKRARATTPRAGAPATGDADPIIPLESVGKPLHDALEAAIPILAACYEQHGGSATPHDAAAQMMMVSDPELGTVIDTDQLTDRDGKPLDREIDTCLRDAIDSLALPPLGQPGRLQVEYTFRFDDTP